jgi:superfamily I DNA/RNA helicase
MLSKRFSPAQILAMRPSELRKELGMQLALDITLADRIANLVGFTPAWSHMSACQYAMVAMAWTRLANVATDESPIYYVNIKRLESMLNDLPGGCEVLPLTVTRRCGRNIVKVAQQVVPAFEAHESNGDGTVSETFLVLDKQNQSRRIEDTYLTKVKSGDMVLARTNGTLIAECFRMIKMGMKANIQGRDIAKGLQSLADKVAKKTVNSTCIEMITATSLWEQEETLKESAKANPSSSRLMNISDKADCLLMFLTQCSPDATLETVKFKIASIFTDEKNGVGVKLSSIHKAKGLEAHNVFFLLPDRAGCPHPMAKVEWELTAEWCLLYVAVTRAVSIVYLVRK